jgi:transcriptional regulator with XRE-family HTH domain
MSQLVAYNLRQFRQAAGLTQKRMGELLGGWSEASVSASERSWDGKRVRKFDADEVTRIAEVLQIPVIALLLPPEDAGTAVEYVFDVSAGAPSDLDSVLSRVIPAYSGDSPVMVAVRQRILALGASSLTTPADITGSAQQILDHAQAAADAFRAKAIGEAEREAEWIIAEARSRGESLILNAENWHTLIDADQQVAGWIDQARRQAEETTRHAAADADAFLARAREQSMQITAGARDRAEKLERDAQERHRQAMLSLGQSREELERRIDDLRAFEREYRVRMIRYFDGQLRDLLAGAEEDDDLPDHLRTRPGKDDGQ